ncbi:endolytic transglycosylase MltG [Rummeliibacillus stabekisii]|uniref:endolytic transglycosylase MltG n=1 Tax=Rummeliibacillus stabekisii TaxID=241244 RepID=UPI00203D7480|nr:endolytic transglycosylase MltG [Rummeliibacillus stabekisii]MCM3316213.1 endolytic transglycosylase MltG [Rummeliibacillus stabekisii]
MRKSTLRSFGLGLFIAGSAMFLYDEFTEKPSNDRIAASSSKGNIVKIQKDKLVSLQKEAAEAKEQLAKIQTDYNQLKNDSAAKKIHSYTLVINRGMDSEDVSQAIKKGGIIKDERAFERFMADKDASKNIQIGDYKLTSDMSNQEILNIITRKK